VLLTMTYLISGPYRRCRYLCIKMSVGSINMHVGCIKMSIYRFVGMVTILGMHGPMLVSFYHLTQRSDTVAGGVGVCDGCVSVT
jgi:hypothetical protein